MLTKQSATMQHRSMLLVYTVLQHPTTLTSLQQSAEQSGLAYK